MVPAGYAGPTGTTALTLVLAAVNAARSRRGRQFDPRVIDAFVSSSDDVFLTKPFSPLDLLRLVDRLCGQSRPT